MTFHCFTTRAATKIITDNFMHFFFNDKFLFLMNLHVTSVASLNCRSIKKQSS